MFITYSAYTQHINSFIYFKETQLNFLCIHAYNEESVRALFKGPVVDLLWAWGSQSVSILFFFGNKVPQNGIS